jgi:hypothetical protein
VDETLSTLSYATRTKNIHNRPTVQYDPREAQISLLRREIELLRQENSLLKEQLQNGGGSVHSSLPTTPDGSPHPTSAGKTGARGSGEDKSWGWGGACLREGCPAVTAHRCLSLVVTHPPCCCWPLRAVLNLPGSPGSASSSAVISPGRSSASLLPRSPSPLVGGAEDALNAVRSNSSPNMPRLPGVRPAAGPGRADQQQLLRSSLNELGE